jgi:porphobilinogen synthase
MDFKEKGAPTTLRRLRQNPWVRELTRELRVSQEQLIQPLFVVEGLRNREEVPGLSDVYRETPDTLLKQIESDLESGVRKFLLFGVPSQKREADFNFDFTTQSIETIKKHFGKALFLAVDVCLCSLTSHGHCGVLSAEGDHVVNNKTVAELTRAAWDYAQAGADCVAPSDMMDGRIAALRAILEHTLIMSYSAKFHSKFYGPFRLAADSAPKPQTGVFSLLDRATYQIDPACPSDAWMSAWRDAEEGADILMVKPALPYLDILSKLSSEIKKPWAAYEVSGEYAAIELLSAQGLMHGPEAHREAWTSIIRAGASMIITYGARKAKNFGVF